MSKSISAQNKQDLEMAKDFLDNFPGRLTIQVIPEGDKRLSHKRPYLDYPRDQLASLKTLNDQGYGIFFTVNETDGKGRKAENIVKVRALFVDLDGAPLTPVHYCPAEPRLIMESSPERYHVYWFVDNVPLEMFTPLQKQLAMKFDGDPNVCDLPRLMRVPGFLHQKAR